MYKNRLAPKFPKAASVGYREWGEEDLLVLVSKAFTLKRIFLKAGCKGGLQYHRLKNECGVIIKGQMIVRFDDGNGNLISRVLGEADIFHFEPGVIHQTEAISDTIYIEASTPHFNDRVHVENLYNLDEESGGLPTTTLDQIELR